MCFAGGAQADKSGDVSVCFNTMYFAGGAGADVLAGGYVRLCTMNLRVVHKRTKAAVDVSAFAP